MLDHARFGDYDKVVSMQRNICMSARKHGSHTNNTLLLLSKNKQKYKKHKGEISV
jgi:hypothetical protein